MIAILPEAAKSGKMRINPGKRKSGEFFPLYNELLDDEDIVQIFENE